MGIKAVRKLIEKKTPLIAVWEAGELFIQTADKNHSVALNQYMAWEEAQELCEDLGLNLQESNIYNVLSPLLQRIEKILKIPLTKWWREDYYKLSD